MGDEPKAGDWAVYPTYKTYGAQVGEIVTVTTKLLKVKDRGTRLRQIKRGDVYATTPDGPTAERLRDAIEGVSGEYHRRRRVADEEHYTRVQAARGAAEKQLARVIAATLAQGHAA